MAHGAPDDSNVKMGVDVTRIDDMAELAARLGSIVTYNRGGNVLLVDGFEAGLNGWGLNTTGVLAAVTLSPEQVFNGHVACRIDTGTGANPYAGIYKYLPTVSPCKVGHQIAFNINSDVDSISFFIRYGFEGDNYIFKVSYNHGLGELSYGNALGGWTLFGTPGKVYDGVKNYHDMKLVVDLVNKEYVRFLLDGEEFDLRGKTPEVGVWGEGDVLFPFLRVYGDGITSGIAYIDNVVVTYNEF